MSIWHNILSKITIQMNSPFIVENAVNTCYIDTVLMGLFFKPSVIDFILNKDIKNVAAIYFQEYIKENFVSSVRNGKSVLKDDMEMIRTMSIHLGWKNKEDYMLQQDVTEYYSFLMDIFEMEKITIQTKDIKENLSFIPLTLLETNLETETVKNMLLNWQTENNSSIFNSPPIIGLSINRFTNTGKKINTNVIIQKKIAEWTFHAAICYKEVNQEINQGHYYALLSGNNGIWYIFDDLKIPCIRSVRMDDPVITDMIKKECYFVFYRK